MPTYEYTCRDCGHTFDIVQSMWDESLTMCPECGGSLRKVFAPPAISFKGSGFYATDHGKKSKSASESRGESKSDGEKRSDREKKSEGDKKSEGSGDQKSDGKKAGEAAKSSGSKERSGGSSSEGRSTPARKEPAPS
jgi:putative FmdB family regulatory protein